MAELASKVEHKDKKPFQKFKKPFQKKQQFPSNPEGTVSFEKTEKDGKSGHGKKQFKKRSHKKKPGLGIKKMPKDADERDELRNEVVEHVNLTRNRTKTLKHFMGQGYPNFLIRRLMGDLFKNPNPEKKSWVVDPEKKSTLKQELTLFMIESKLDKKDNPDQLKALLKHFKPKGFSKGQIRSAHHQYVVRIHQRGKPKKLGSSDGPMVTPGHKDGSPNSSDSGVENIEPSPSATDVSANSASLKRKSCDSAANSSPVKVSKMTTGIKSGKKNKNKALGQSPTNVTRDVSAKVDTMALETSLSQESMTTPFPEKPEGYINRKTMRKLKREALEAAKSGFTPSAPVPRLDPSTPSPFKTSFTPTVPKIEIDSEQKLPTPVKLLSPEKQVSSVPMVIASPKLETSEHPLAENVVKKSPSPVKQQKQTPKSIKKVTPQQTKQLSLKKQTLKSSLKKKGKNQVLNNLDSTPKEEKRVSFGKNQIKEFNRKDSPNVSKAIKIKSRETDLIKFTPMKSNENLMGFETPARGKLTTNEQTTDDDCPQLISVLDEPTPELKAVTGTPVQTLEPMKKKKKTPPKFSPRMTRSAAKKRVP